METHMYGSIRVLQPVVAALAMFVLGSVWFGPLFSKPWTAAMGISPESMKDKPRPSMAPMLVGSFIGSLVMAFTMDCFIDRTMSRTLAGGACIGLLASIGFVATAYASTYLFGQKPFKLYVIDVGYQVVGLTLAGAILGAWG